MAESPEGEVNMARRESVNSTNSSAGIAQLANQYVSSLQKTTVASPQAKLYTSLADLPASPDFGEFQPIQQPDSGGVGSWLLDMITRPLAAVAGASYATSRNINVLQGDSEGQPVLNPFSEAWSGFMGDTKHTFADVIKEDLRGSELNKIHPTALFDKQNVTPEQKIRAVVGTGGVQSGPSLGDTVAGTAGFGLDVTFDPANLIAGPAVRGVAQGIKFIKGIGKGTEVAENLSKAGKTSVTGISPVDEHLRILDERATAEPRPDPVPASTTEPVPVPSIADKIIGDVSKPPDVIPSNQVRPAKEPVFVDNFSMGGALSDITGKSAKSFDAAERAKPRLPSYISEINPDEYLAAVNFVRGGDIVKPRHLSDWFDNMDIKTAQRYLSMMEKDGIIETTKSAAQHIGVKPNSHITRRVLDKEGKLDPAGFLINRQPVTDASRAAALYDNVIPQLDSHFEDLANKGIQPRVQAADGSAYTLSTADILKSIPRESVERLNFGAGGKANLYPSQWHAGAAQALRMSELGVPAETAVAEVERAMRSALRGNAVRKVGIESTGNLSHAAEVLVAHTDQLAERVGNNAKRFATKNSIDTSAIVGNKLDDIARNLKEGSTAEAMAAVSNVGKDLATDSRLIGATNDASISAAQEIAPAVAKLVPEADQAAVKVATRNAADRARLGYNPEVDGKLVRRLNSMYVTVARDMDNSGVDELVLGGKHALHMNGFKDRLMHPLRNAFEYGYRTMGHADSWRTLASRSEQDMHHFRGVMRETQKKFGKPAIDTAWTALRRGGIPNDPKVLGAYTELQKLWNHTVGNGLQGRFWRNGASIDAVNSALDEAGLSYRFKKATDPKLVPEQVKDWDIKDPLSDLEKLNKAAHLIEDRQAVSASFASEFGSGVPKPGYVRVSFAKNSKLGPFIDRSLYYPREAGEAIYQLDKLVSSTRTFANEKGSIAWIANNLIDPVMRTWKPFMTVARPGFVPRNFGSDIIMGTFNNVWDPTSYTTASKSLMAAGEFISPKSGIEGLQALRDGDYVSGAGKALTYKGTDISYQGLYKMAHDQGLLQSWHISEDIMEKAGSFTDKMLNNPYMNFMGKVNEIEGQFVRVAHFADLLKRGKSAEEAGKLVRKFHPDVNGLTPIETKYLRRIFPFYTWLRQAIPVVLSTMVSKPGRVSGLFKAEYNAAIAAGQNPDNIIDPFPDDKLYPSFIRNNLTGPLAGDFGLNLGTPAEGVLGDVLQGNPARNIGGMLNPVLKAPYEIATRTNVGTGGNISDMSDYLDSQIPVVNQIANISGYSVTGLGAQQRAAELGEKQHFFNTSMVNFLTGIGLQDYGKPSYKRFAAREAEL